MSARGIITAATEAGLMIGTAESLTGGALAAALTSVPGAAKAYVGGVVSYHNDVKHRLLDVDTHLLEEPGPVSSQVARAMAAGARRALDVDIAVSTTGVAGPQELDGHAPGTAWIGIDSDLGTDSYLVHVEGDREHVQAAVVAHALEFLGRTVRAVVGAGEHN